CFPPYPAVVWHDHYGPYIYDSRPAWLYRQVARRVKAVIAVNHALAEWSKTALAMEASRVWYVPNFVCEPSTTSLVTLPGVPGARIVCTANLRPQKDHLTLIRAMPDIIRAHSDAHLLIVGAIAEPAHHAALQVEVARLQLRAHVTFLGRRRDVFDVL